MLLSFNAPIWFYTQPVDFRNYVKYLIMCSDRGLHDRYLCFLLFLLHIILMSIFLILTWLSAYQVL